ncbi:MAG: zinc ABC transporter substrate-binding protein [Verrucomicrobiae bacterium]|nr:zinc ABC transporter substrate-binding protein [Verrucomicrobiae bacterium]
MTTFRSFLCAAAIAAGFSGCDSSSDGDGASQTGSGKPVVLTTNYPLTWMAERIGGDAVEVVYPAPPDEDPAFWQPNDADIARYQAADLILRNGATYEKWADKVSLPESSQVDTSKAFSEQFIIIKDAHTHSHGSAGEHSHSGVAFTTWIDFSQAIQQADAIRAAFGKRLPDQAKEFDSRFASLRTELEALDAELALVAQSIGNAPLVASHPVYQYLARRYGLNIRSVLWEPEEVPDDSAMADLSKLLAEHPAKTMIWEGEPAPESVKKLEAIGVRSLVFAPCGNRPAEGSDFLSVMKANLGNLAKIAPPGP